MLLGSIQIQGQKLSNTELQDVNGSLSNHRIRLLSLRDCRIKDSDFNLLMRSVGECKSVIQLNLSVGIIHSSTRIQMVADALLKNRSLTTLFLHGSQLGDRGCRKLTWALASHPNVVSLDLGDCRLTDGSIQGIADLLPPNGAKRGLQELTLSGNSSITPAGWTKFFIGMSASATLHKLYLDYNNIGDLGTSCLAVALASNHTLELLDLEATGITKEGAEVLLHLVKRYPVSIKKVILTGNDIHQSYIDTIESHLDTGHQDQGTVEALERDDHPVDSETSTEVESVSEISESFPAPGTIITGPGGGGMVLRQEDIPQPKPQVVVTNSTKPKSVVFAKPSLNAETIESSSGESEESQTGSFLWMDREEHSDSEESSSEGSDSEYSDDDYDEDDDDIIVGNGATKAKSKMLSTGDTIHKVYQKQLRKL